MAAVVHVCGRLLPFAPPLKLAAQVALGAGWTIGLAELTRMDCYRYLKKLALDKIASGKIPPAGTAGENGSESRRPTGP